MVNTGKPKVVKNKCVSFDKSNNAVSIYVKMDGSVLEEQSSFKILRLSLSFKLVWGPYIVSIAKDVPRRLDS